MTDSEIKHALLAEATEIFNARLQRLKRRAMEHIYRGSAFMPRIAAHYDKKGLAEAEKS